MQSQTMIETRRIGPERRSVPRVKAEGSIRYRPLLNRLAQAGPSLREQYRDGCLVDVSREGMAFIQSDEIWEGEELEVYVPALPNNPKGFLATVLVVRTAWTDNGKIAGVRFKDRVPLD